MIAEERVMELFAEDNPIPSVDDLDLADLGPAAYLATLEQRSSDMTQLETKQPEQQRPRSRRLVAVLATAMAALLIGAVVILTQDDEAPPAATEPAPTPTTLASVEVPTTVTADVPAEVEPFIGNEPAGTYRPFFFEPSFVFTLAGEGWAATENADRFFALVPPGGSGEVEFETDAFLFFVAPELGSVDETMAYIEGISGLEVSEPQPTSIGGADGMLVIATATESTVPIWTDYQTVFYETVTGHQYRFHVLDVDGVPVVITLDYRNEEQYQRLVPTVEEFLGSITWNDLS